MLAKRRHQHILHLLESAGEVKIQELATHFSVSTMTIRRDLEGLEGAGLLQRTHGGAVSINRDSEPPLANKQAMQQQEKQEIASVALDQISPGMSVILDAGSTTCALAHRLIEKAPLTVVTTDLEIARILSDYADIETFLTGGQVKGGVYRLEGDYTLHLLREVSADVAFLGCDGFTQDHVFSNTMGQVALKQAIMTAASRKILLADSSKYGKAAFSKVASLLDFDLLITDSKLPPDAGPELYQKTAVFSGAHA